MHKKRVDVVLVSLSSPMFIGIYHEKRLIEQIESKQKSSDVLASIYKEIFLKYEVEHLIYANGPGSFMAIKIAYIFLKTLSVVKEIPLLCQDAFYFNNNAPIKALGKLYFVKIQNKIQKQKFEEAPECEFVLPQTITYEDFKNDCLPDYNIDAVEG